MRVKRTMTINLHEAEMKLVEDLCENKGVTKTALVRQALRLMQLVDEQNIYVYDPLTELRKKLEVI